ncbi:Mercuric resistance operon regulatory protein [Minicystis rosea]|nr:Mercuric resistance operon regulatory protein [Minicystis rosea]
MRIGEAARRAGVRVVTVRFYEAQGLLPKAARTESGYRDLPASIVQRLRFIRRAQELGFTLAEIRSFLAASDARGQLRAEQIRPAAEAKLADLDARIKDLRRMQKAIHTLLERGEPHGDCPILASLGGALDTVEAPPKRKRG